MKFSTVCTAATAAAMFLCAGTVWAQVGAIPANPLAAVGVERGSLVQLAVDTTPERPMRIAVPIDGVVRVLNLAPFSIRSEDFKLYEQTDAGTFEVKAPPINTLRGVVEEEPGAVVAGGVMPDGLYARIILADGSEWWIEPVGGRAAVEPGTHAIYRTEDVRKPPAWCGTDAREHGVHDRGVASPAENLGATIYIATVAVDTDWEFYNRYGSTGTTSARINLVYNTMNLQYERDVDIRHIVSSITVRTTTADPYASGTTGGMLGEMRTFWNANNSGNLRDVAHLFTGKVTGGVIGTAYLGVICSNLSSGFGYGVSQTDWNNANFASATDVVAHETGHNWNADHCTCANPAYTMNPSITSINRFSPADTFPDIVAHRNSRGCLSTTVGGGVAPNDLCGDAIVIGTGTIGFSNIGAVTDGPAACGAFGDDIWYLYTAPCDGTVTVTTCGSTFDTTLAAYTGGCTSLTELTCNDDNAACGGSPPRQSFIQFPVTRSVTYRIRVGGFGGVNGSGLLTVSQTSCPAPANDDCADAQNVSEGVYAFSTIGATTDGWVDDGPGCTAFGYAQTGSDIWFRYVAPCTGTVEFSTCGSGYDTRLAAYAACPTGPFQAIACNDDSCGTRSVLQIAVVANTAYLVRLGGYNGGQGTGTLTVRNLTCPPPANDNCVNAIDVSSGGTFNGTLVNTSNDGAATCGASANNGDVWYTFTAPGAGTLRVTTCGTHDGPGLNSGMDTVLSLHDGCGGTQIDCNDDTSTCGTLDQGTLRDSAVGAAMSAGQTVAIRVSKFGTSSFGYGPFTLNVSFTPANDACSDPIVIGDGTIPFSTLFATTDGTPACGAMGSDIWYIYQATCTGRVRVDTCNSVYDTVLAVYPAGAGCTPATADLITCNDDSPFCNEPLPRDSFVEFAAQAGQRYRIRVGGFSGARGTGRLTVDCRTACAPCAADYDQSGGVDGDDIGAFFDDWQQGAPCADVDSSGGIDGDDIGFFFVRWRAGGC